jgi:hypothetical protein
LSLRSARRKMPRVTSVKNKPEVYDIIALLTYSSCTAFYVLEYMDAVVLATVLIGAVV